MCVSCVLYGNHKEEVELCIQQHFNFPNASKNLGPNWEMAPQNKNFLTILPHMVDIHRIAGDLDSKIIPAPFSGFISWGKKGRAGSAHVKSDLPELAWQEEYDDLWKKLSYVDKLGWKASAAVHSFKRHVNLEMKYEWYFQSASWQRLGISFFFMYIHYYI